MTLGLSFPPVLAAAQANAAWAFERLYREFAPPIAGYLRLHGLGDPDDVVNETFVSAFSALARFEGGEDEFRTWLFTIANRRLVDEWRRASARPQASDPEVADATSGEAEDTALAVGSERVRALLSTLAPDQRDVLLLRIVADMTVEEAAQVLGKSEGEVKALQRRACAAVLATISRDGVSPAATGPARPTAASPASGGRPRR